MMIVDGMWDWARPQRALIALVDRELAIICIELIKIFWQL